MTQLKSHWVRRAHSAFSRLCGHNTLVLFRSSWKDLLCFPWSKINNTPITPARFFHRPHSSRQNTGCHYSQEITRQRSHLCQSHSVLVPCDWSWLYAVPGLGKESLFLLCQVSFRFPAASSWFQLWLRNQPTKLPCNCSFWPKECGPVFSTGLKDLLVPGIHCQPCLPHLTPALRTLGRLQFPTDPQAGS